MANAATVDRRAASPSAITTSLRFPYINNTMAASVVANKDAITVDARCVDQRECYITDLRLTQISGTTLRAISTDYDDDNKPTQCVEESYPCPCPLSMDRVYSFKLVPTGNSAVLTQSISAAPQTIHLNTGSSIYWPFDATGVTTTVTTTTLSTDEVSDVKLLLTAGLEKLKSTGPASVSATATTTGETEAETATETAATTTTTTAAAKSAASEDFTQASTAATSASDNGVPRVTGSASSHVLAGGAMAALAMLM
ncbi:hypothetical protein KEM52_001604 [Ascosphaera acerosa]|nr:hypothetical protein KEM52_001604 [Ascosphaera acerosa]